MPNKKDTESPSGSSDERKRTQSPENDDSQDNNRRSRRKKPKVIFILHTGDLSELSGYYWGLLSTEISEPPSSWFMLYRQPASNFLSGR